MKKLFFLTLLLIAGSAFAQGDNSRSFYVLFGRHFTTFETFNRDIDTINNHSTIAGDYGHLLTHFVYGGGMVRKRKWFETGFNVQWGNTKEMVAGGDNPATTAIETQDYWVRQRLFILNSRIGLSLGNNFSLGSDLGGMISNFQHLERDQDQTPLWFITFSGQRSFLGNVSPYLSVHYAEIDGVYVGLEIYASFTLGQTRYDQAFEKALFYPDAEIAGRMNMRFFGAKLKLGLCR